MRSVLSTAFLAAATLLTASIPLLAQDSSAATSNQPVFLKPGDVVAPFEAKGIDGTEHKITFPKGTTTILLFFSSGCPHCHKMIPMWNERFAERTGSQAVVGVIVDKAPEIFFQRVSILFPVLQSPGNALLNAFKVERVPITLRVGAGGKVEDIGVGELDGIRLGQLFKP
jgi:thiol-disulfide isomerase/thioredoxin